MAANAALQAQLSLTDQDYQDSSGSQPLADASSSLPLGRSSSLGSLPSTSSRARTSSSGFLPTKHAGRRERHLISVIEATQPDADLSAALEPTPSAVDGDQVLGSGALVEEILNSGDEALEGIWGEEGEEAQAANSFAQQYALPPTGSVWEMVREACSLGANNDCAYGKDAVVAAFSHGSCNGRYLSCHLCCLAVQLSAWQLKASLQQLKCKNSQHLARS